MHMYHYLTIFFSFFSLTICLGQDIFSLHPADFGAGYSNGISWGDYNNDGYQDFFITNGHQSTTPEQNLNLLFLNNTNGVFTLQTAFAGPIATDQFVSGSSSWGDYDNDGYLDLFIADVYRVPASFPNSYTTIYSLYDNNQDGSFSRTDAHGDLTQSTYECGVSGAWADYNNDGYLDIALSTQFIQVVVYKNFNALFLNNQDGTFSKQNNTFTAGETHQGGLSWADFDQDGDQDIVSVAGSENQNTVLYVNTGTDFDPMILLQNEDARGASWGDYDNDGDLDLLITVNGMNLNSGSQPQSNYLFENLGDTLVSVSAGTLTSDTDYTNASAWADFDNDGDLDVFIGNSSDQSEIQKSYLYVNDGTGNFSKLLNTVLSDSSEYVRAAAWADFDRDGDLDIALARDGTNRVFSSNIDNGNHFLQIKLIGISANRNGIGSLIKIKAIINGEPTWQLRDINAQTGFAGQNSLIAHFGLGDATMIDSIVVDWAGSTARDVLTDIPANQFLEITENQTSDLHQVEAELPYKFLLYQNYPNPFNPNTTIRYAVPPGVKTELKIFNALGVLIQVFDQSTQNAGNQTVQFNGTGLASGIYYYQLSVGSFSKIRKMILLK